jgi:hypothetical protein
VTFTALVPTSTSVVAWCEPSPTLGRRVRLELAAAGLTSLPGICCEATTRLGSRLAQGGSPYHLKSASFGIADGNEIAELPFRGGECKMPLAGVKFFKQIIQPWQGHLHATRIVCGRPL